MNTKPNAPLWLTLSLLAACQSPSSEPDPAEPPPAERPIGALVAGPERRPNLVDHATLAFRPRETALVGGYRTHQASVRDGSVVFTPYTFPSGQRRAHVPLALETTAITAADSLIASGATSTRLDDGKVLVDRDGVTEVLRNEIDGLHQEWRFATAPDAEGELTVEVAIDGYAYTGETAGGLHFTAADGSVGVRYSHAVWIAANGAEWPITAAFSDGRIRMTVPASVIEQTEFPALLDPTVSAEVAADAIVTGPTGASQQHATITSGGGQYLVVWSDNRDGADSDIWGTRLDSNGAILDPLGIQIAAGPGIQQQPTVAFDGTSFVVAWEDLKVTNGTEADIDAAVVSSAGAVTPLAAVASTATSETAPSIASRGGGNALLTWNAGGTVNAAVYNGTFGAPFPIASGTVVERTGVAGNPAGDYLVTFSTGTNLRGQLVTSTGTLNGTAFDISASNGTQSSSAVTWNGTNFAVVYVNNNAGINIYGTAVSPAGMVLNTRTEGTATVGGVAITTAPENQQFPGIACAGTGCLVVWQDRRNLPTTSFDIYGQLVNFDFTLSGSELIISNASGRQNTPAVAASGTGYMTVWPDLRDNNVFATFGSSVSSAGAIGTAAPLGTGNNRESGPALGRASGNYGLFWSDSRTFGNDIRFVRFGGGGAKLDVTALVASSAAHAQISPAATTELGTHTLVVWSDTRGGASKDIYAARVSLATGNVADPAGIALATAANDQLVPDAASNGTVALAVWQDRRSGTFDIYGALVDANGAVVTSDIIISNAASDQVRPAVTWDATAGQFVVVWQDLRAGGMYHVYGARVSAAGTVLDPAGVQISSGAVGQFTPGISSTAAGTLVVWQDRKNAPAVRIWGARVIPGGSLSVQDANGFQIGSGAGRQSGPKIGTIGTSFVVLWVDDRAGQDDIYAQQVTSTGTLSGTEFAVSTTSDPENAIAIVGAGGTSTSLRVAYETHRENTARIATRVISSQTDQGAVCSGAGQCSSGFCVDGYCCESACGGNHVPVSGTSAGDCHGCAARFTGVANGTCAPLPTTTMCRNYASTYCDVREYCDGSSMACPDDVGRRQGLACNMSTNSPPGVGTGTCPSNAAPGPHFCQ